MSEAVMEQQIVSAQMLIDSMCNMLQEAGHAAPRKWIEFVQALNPACALKDTETRMLRYLINSYWFQQLGMLSMRLKIDTTRARFCIEDRCSHEEWEDLYRKEVVPTIAHYQL